MKRADQSGMEVEHGSGVTEEESATDDAKNPGSPPTSPPRKEQSYFSKLVNKAYARVQESAEEGANFGRAAVRTTGRSKSGDRASGETAGAGADSTYVDGVASAVGTILGLGVGLLKASVGVPLDMSREKSRKSFLKGLKTWAPREIKRALEAPPAFPAEQAVRVVAIRHGHGYHNDLGGLMSPINADPHLTSLGREEAELSQEALRNIPFDLVIVSPFTRTLETAYLVLGKERASMLPTIVEPLAAEHNGGQWNDDDLNAATSVVARGDHGSPGTELARRFPVDKFPQYANAFSQLPKDWWTHGQELGFESKASFTERSIKLRLALGKLSMDVGNEALKARPRLIALVSHGGILTKSFGNADGSKGEKFKNCEFRVFDVSAQGEFKRPLTETELSA